MKRLATLLALVPGTVLAHGGHAPMPEPAHAVSHAGPLIGLAVIGIAIAMVAYQRWMS